MKTSYEHEEMKIIHIKMDKNGGYNSETFQKVTVSVRKIPVSVRKVTVS